MFDRPGQRSLVTGAGSRDPAGKNFPLLGNEFLKARDILIIDRLHLLNTKLADLFPEKVSFLPPLAVAVFVSVFKIPFLRLTLK